MRWIGSLLILAAIALQGCAGRMISDSADFQKAAQLNAELGLNYMAQGKNEMAMEKLERALEYDASSTDAHHYIAELYRRLERPEKAATHYRRAIALAPGDPSIQNNFGVFLCSTEQYDEGVRHLLRAVDNPVWPGRDQAYENIGQCLQDKGEIVQAEHYYREALKVNPEQPKALLALGEISLEQDNPISARAFLQRFEELAIHTPRSLWLGIRVERLLGDRDALSSYGMLLRNNFPDAEETGLYLQSQ